MELTRIIALVPENEHFDATALNEGIWLTVGHVSNIENALSTQAASQAEVTSQRDNIQQQLTDAQAASQTATVTHQQEIAQRDQQIATLNAEIANLKKSPAGEFQNTNRGQDEFVPAEVASYDDPNNAFNKYAD